MGYRDVVVSMEWCPSCREQVRAGTVICPACRNPVDIDRLTELRVKARPDLLRVYGAMGALTFVSAMSVWIEQALGHSIVPALVPVVFYAACLVAATWVPLGASIAAVAVFLFDHAAALAEGNVHFLVRGVVLTLVAVGALVAGIRGGYRVRDLRGQWRKRDWVLGMGVLVASVVAGLIFGLTRG